MDTEAGFTGPVNIGNPGEFTMLELAEKVVRLTRSASTIEHKPLPQDDPKQRQPNIEQAKAVLLSQPVHLLVTALALPDMDGTDLAAYAREQSTQSYFPIIVVSGEVQERLEQRSLSQHAGHEKTLGSSSTRVGAAGSFHNGCAAPAGR